MKSTLRALPWFLSFVSSGLVLAALACNDTPVPDSTDADAQVDADADASLGTIVLPKGAIAIELQSGGGMPSGCGLGDGGADADSGDSAADADSGDSAADGSTDSGTNGNRTPTTTLVLRFDTKTIERVYDPACDGPNKVSEVTPPAATFDALVVRAESLPLVSRPKSCGVDGPSYIVRGLTPTGAGTAYMSSSSDDACRTDLATVDGQVYAKLWQDIVALLPAL